MCSSAWHWRWVPPSGDLPPPRYGTAVEFDIDAAMLYVHGGFSRAGGFSDMWEYSVEANTWTEHNMKWDAG